jgi:two-component system response regulator AtoC
VLGFDSGDQVLYHLASVPAPSILILDIHMPRVGGLQVLEELNRQGRHIPTVVLSGMQQVNTVVKAMRFGASDYLVKPVDETEMEATVSRVIEEFDDTSACSSASEDVFATSNGRMAHIRNICDKVAHTDVPVLILGESGVGKEVLARYLHTRSGREPFVKVNCAALPGELLESELFGHERGAFTGAQREKPGKFELANDGSIMLDEVAEMSPFLQAKLLHVLQDGEYSRLGGTRPMRSGARVIAATNKNLQTLVANGQFREDLYFRMNVVTVELPPLRQRSEDIRPLCEYFVEKYRGKYKSTVKALPEELLTAFCNYHWPGNIRQLENAIRRFLILPDLAQARAEFRSITPIPESTVPAHAGLSLKELSAGAAEKAEKELILRTLNEVNWNRKQAARSLNICYKSLLNKLHRWQLQSRPAQADQGSEDMFEIANSGT